MYAAPVLIDRSMTNFSAWVGGNRNRIKSKMAPRYIEKRTSITTVRDQYLSSATFPTPFIFHYPLPLEEKNAKLQHVPHPGTFIIDSWNYTLYNTCQASRIHLFQNNSLRLSKLFIYILYNHFWARYFQQSLYPIVIFLHSLCRWYLNSC